jgi:hypothetical protein
MHAWLLWETNTDGQYILDPYATTSYCIFYLTKVDKSITCEM